MPQEWLACRFDQTDHAAILWNDELADLSRRNEGAGLESQVITEATDCKGVSIAGQELAPDRYHQIAYAAV